MIFCFFWAIILDCRSFSFWAIKKQNSSGLKNPPLNEISFWCSRDYQRFWLSYFVTHTFKLVIILQIYFGKFKQHRAPRRDQFSEARWGSVSVVNLERLYTRDYNISKKYPQGHWILWLKTVEATFFFSLINVLVGRLLTLASVKLPNSWLI